MSIPRKERKCCECGEPILLEIEWDYDTCCQCLSEKWPEETEPNYGQIRERDIEARASFGRAS